MKDKQMAATSDLYLPFSLMAVIINHWNLKFCTDTDHKRTNKFRIKFDVSVTVHHIYISKEMYELDANNFTMILFS